MELSTKSTDFLTMMTSMITTYHVLRALQWNVAARLPSLAAQIAQLPGPWSTLATLCPLLMMVLISGQPMSVWIITQRKSKIVELMKVVLSSILPRRTVRA